MFPELFEACKKYLGLLYCCASFFIHTSSHDNVLCGGCFEIKTLATTASAGKKYYYDTAFAVVLLDEWERMIFQAAIIASPHLELTQLVTKKIQSLFYAMHTEQDRVALRDQQAVIQRLFRHELRATMLPTEDIQYVHHQASFNVDTKKFENSVPKLLVPQVLQSLHVALPESALPEEAFDVFKEVVERDLGVGAVSQEVPVIVINEQACAALYPIYRSYCRCG
jgi:hypothetical protein